MMIVSKDTSGIQKKEITMKEEIFVSEKKIAKLSKRLAKSLSLSHDEAMELIHEEWDYVESLFHQHQKVKTVHHYLIEEINYTYRIA